MHMHYLIHIKIAVMDSIEQRGTKDFAKVCGKISGPNILASENTMPQQKSQHKFHTSTKSTPVPLRQ